MYLICAVLHSPSSLSTQALGQKGDSPAPISPLSPLHSPDSLEELSLTESPNQPPTSGSAAPLGSFSTEPPTTHSKNMPWEGEEGTPGHGHSQNKNDLLVAHNPCEDSGVSFSPEEKMASSDRSSTGPSPVTPQMMLPESDLTSSNPTEHWDSHFLTSQDSSKISMDPFSKETTAIGSKYESDLQGNNSDEDDDLMFEMKKNNPFDGFSPLSESRTTKMSESPTPDLKATDSFIEDEAVPPRSLPDILKSSPLNPDKMDSGSSEGTPEDHSPILERKMMESPNPPINLSTNPFAFEGKVSLLKEMAEEMEVKASEHAKLVDDNAFGAFDLVKEAEETTPTKGKDEEPVKIEQKDWFAGFDSPKKPENLEPFDFKIKKQTGEDSDSESPTADSLSPVLEAMAKNPASFQVETDKQDLKMEEPDVAEEVSEHEVSSEEFEFIERPPRGVIDEFLEALDTSKFVTPTLLMDEEVSTVNACTLGGSLVN
uniref:Uncharacterized protein n=1 Tax=Periophthalmus magnuspinnatus TaxID=409849 RepID=A0A3B4AR35_9GOBI